MKRACSHPAEFASSSLLLSVWDTLWRVFMWNWYIIHIHSTAVCVCVGKGKWSRAGWQCVCLCVWRWWVQTVPGDVAQLKGRQQKVDGECLMDLCLFLSVCRSASSVLSFALSTCLFLSPLPQHSVILGDGCVIGCCEAGGFVLSPEKGCKHVRYGIITSCLPVRQGSSFFRDCWGFLFF